MITNCVALATQRLVSLVLAISLTVVTFPGLLYNAGQ
jgi:hypothetical protein